MTLKSPFCEILRTQQYNPYILIAVNYKKLLLLAGLCLLLLSKAGSQDIHVGNRYEIIRINEDTTFERQVSVVLKKSDEIRFYPVFYDTELENISDIKTYTKKGNQLKQTKSTVHETEVELDIMTSKKIKAILVPSGFDTKITYQVKCEELMYLSDLLFFSYDSIDTLDYRIIVPKSFRLAYDILRKDSLKYLAIDSLVTDQQTEWHITLIPVKVAPDPMMVFGVYKNMSVPLMRTIVFPSDYGKSENCYLNDWYLSRVEKKRGLDSTVTRKIDDLTMGITDSMKIAELLYDYVRTKFKYVAIEMGMGAFIPNHVNDVFTNKQGDCKDLSNFLSEILNYKGIKADVALASTYHHITDCDFPSLVSANHVICFAYINGQPVILDPTDPVHKPLSPVQSIQERTVFIVNREGGSFYKIPGFSAKNNLIQYDIELKADSLTMEGGFTVDYSGMSGNFLKRDLLNLKDQERNSIGKKHYETVFGNQSVNDFHINTQADPMTADAKLTIRGKILNDKNSRFLFIDFLPALIESETRETLLEGTYIGNTIGKKVRAVLSFKKPFEVFAPIEYNYISNKVSISVKISCITAHVVQCEYSYYLDYFAVNNDNKDFINKSLKSFKKYVNDPIVLKNKVE